MLYQTYKKYHVFEWDDIISNELAFQLTNLSKMKRFVIMAYLIIGLISSDNFSGLSCNPKFNVNQEPMQFRYPILWKNNASSNFYLIQDAFARQINYMITRQEPHHICGHTQVSLWGKDIHEERESNTLIQIYGFQGKSLLLHKFVTDKYFIVEVYRQYLDQLDIFERKKIKQFIPFLFTLGEIILKITSHVTDFTRTLNAFNLSKVEAIKAFNEEGLFHAHQERIGYSNLFAKIREQIEQWQDALTKKQWLIINIEDIMEVSRINISEDQFVHYIKDTHGNQGLIINVEQIIHESRINSFVEQFVYQINDIDASSLSSENGTKDTANTKVIYDKLSDNVKHKKVD